MYDIEVVELAIEAGSVGRQIRKQSTATTEGDLAALAHVERICRRGHSPTSAQDVPVGLTHHLHRAAHLTGDGTHPAASPLGTVIRHAAELVRAGHHHQAVLNALAHLLDPDEDEDGDSGGSAEDDEPEHLPAPFAHPTHR